jgi:hypothetical protein
MQKKYTRISLEASGKNEAALNFFLKLGALNLTKEEGWINYSFTPSVIKKMLNKPKEVENIRLRPTEPKDCVQIQEMIQELAEFEKMPEGPQLTVKGFVNPFYIDG